MIRDVRRCGRHSSHIVGRSLLVLLIAGGTVPAVGVGPAAACSCATATDAVYRQQAEVVFTGSLLRREEPRGGKAVQSSTDPAIYTFAVDRVFKGEVTDPQQVVSAASGASCGLELPGTGPFLVFAGRPADRSDGADTAAEYADLPRASLCGGSRSLAAGEEPFGRGRAPIPAPTSLADSTTTLGPTSDDDGTGNAVTLGLGALACALIAGGFVLRRRSRP